jgi:two-component system sensor histidine kinase PilS (NtrC family)
MRDKLLSSVWVPLQRRADSMPVPEEWWRSASLFNFYRLILAALFLFSVTTLDNVLSLGTSDPPLFLRTAGIYILLILISQLGIGARQPRFYLQLSFQVGADIVCLTVLSHASGGIQSGLGLLLLVSLAAAGMISRGRITLFFAALASIAVLLQQSYAVLTQEAPVAQYFQAGLLSAAYFIFAWVAHTLAKYATASENLATSRGVDLSNMAEANRLAIQDMPDGVLVVDESGVVRQSNPSAEQLLGYVFPAEDGVLLAACSPLLEERFAAWRLSRSIRPEELRLPGTDHSVTIRFLPVQREGFWGAVVFLEDMQRAQTQAQQIKLAALGRLTASIAHEVRNPLSAISYAAELLQEDEHVAAQERLFQIIMDNATRLDYIVKDILQLNRRDRLNSEAIDLAEKLPLYVEGLQEREGVSQDVILVEAALPGVVRFDRGHLDQVLWNLCRNALRYCSGRAGSVQLRAARSNKGRIVLEIFNDGPPVPDDTVPKLFEPFFTTSAGGTGLGLYIARELCEANGAAIGYRPPPEGGVCFRIEFGGTNER